MLLQASCSAQAILPVGHTVAVPLCPLFPSPQPLPLCFQIDFCGRLLFILHLFSAYCVETQRSPPSVPPLQGRRGPLYLSCRCLPFLFIRVSVQSCRKKRLYSTTSTFMAITSRDSMPSLRYWLYLLLTLVVSLILSGHSTG